MEYRCVHCGEGVKTLLVQYSPGNIRLMKCEKCKAVADEYIECDITIVLIDLILHKRKAYRHLLHNVLRHDTVDVEGILLKSKMGKKILLQPIVLQHYLGDMGRLLLKSSSQVARNKELFLAILVSSYMKIFVVAMLVWGFPPSVLLIIDLFVLSSNAVALTGCVSGFYCFMSDIIFGL
ncbi:hypothetical protein ACLOJK_016814 [Asimina triloba]